MRDYRCSNCGLVFPISQATEKRVAKGVRFAQPGDCTPDEYLDACPDCGSVRLEEREAVTT